MASIKDYYKIPHSINVKEGLDTPVALKFGAIGFAMPIPIALIMMVIGSMMVYVCGVIYITKNNFGILSGVLFTISFIPLARMMLKKTETGERGYKWVVPTLSYYPSYKLRMIRTRSTISGNEVEQLKNVIGLEEIDPKSGIARFTNGDTGVAVNVIGNGNKTLFDNEVERIVLAYEQFLRELDLGVHFIVDMKEGKQDCTSQIEALETQKMNNNNPTVNLILDRRITTLKHIQNNFRTTEYTTYLRSNDVAKLDNTIKALKQTSSSGIFKYFQIAYDEEVYERYKDFYNLQ
jgi:hypothetical protein